MLNPTHDPGLRSWVASAQRPGSDFPIHNLPHGVFRPRGGDADWRGGVAIGDMVLDLRAALGTGAFAEAARLAAQAAGEDSLNALMALGPAAWHGLRAELSRLLREDAPEAARLRECLVPQAQADYTLPAHIGDYTDFFSSWHHMLNAGRIFQPDAPPLPNFRWLPIAYHGRASTVEVSGAPVHRPQGQTRPPGSAEPLFGPTQRLDHEFELAVWIGTGNRRGRSIPVDAAEQHVFGLGLLNDWSARDVQAWEALPLGPFLAKNFLTTVSPWIVTLEALAPFRCALPRGGDDPPTLPSLRGIAALPGFDLQLEASLQTPASGGLEMPLSRSSFRHCYWSIAQMVAHHTEGGCALRPGDLLGTGTQSGPGAGEQGCLLELSRGGREAITLANGEQRTYLQDGDTVVLRAWGEQPGAARIGFGECRGTVHAAPAS
jgi:fumarylacetoacetase